MLRALFLIALWPLACVSQSLIEEAVTGLLGRTARVGRNFADVARRDPPSPGFIQGLLDAPQKSTVVLRPQDGTVIGGLFRGFMKDVDDNGKANSASILHPDQHQVVGALIGGLASGRATASKATTPMPEEDVLGLIESIGRRRNARPSATTKSESPPVTITPAPASALLPAPPLAVPLPVRDEPSPAPGVLDEFRRDVQRDAPECSQKAKAQLSKVLGNFRKGVLECVGVDDADVGDVINRLRQVLLTADRLPTSLVQNLGRCSAAAAAAAAARNTTSTSSSSITRIPQRSRTGQSNPAELSAARCILQALADARDRLHKIPSETAAFSRRVAFLLAGTKTDARVRACVASQLTSMAHPIVATTRYLAGCVMVGPDFSTE